MPKIDAWELYRKASIGHYGTERYDEFARLIIEECAKAAESHECGGPDDFICQGQNCAMLCAAAIRALKP